MKKTIGEKDMWAVIAVLVVASVVLAFFIAERLFRRYMLNRSFGAKEVDTTTSEGTMELTYEEDGTPCLRKRRPDGTLSDDFKVLSTTDTHLRSELSDFTLEVLGKFLDKEKPDIVVLVGDNVVDRTDTVIHEKVKKFFEDRGQYWAFVLGNHDGEGYQAAYPDKDSRKWAYQSLAGSPHCLTRNEDAGYGYGNSVVLLKNSRDKIAQAIFLLDSDRHMTEESCREIGQPYKKGCAFLRPCQVEWYQKRVADITRINGGEIPKSLMYFHIPLHEFDVAYSNLKNPRVKRLYGDAWEKIDCSCYSTGMFEAIKEEKSTQAVICGHDHINCFCLEYDGIVLMYSLGLQWDMSYNRRKNNKFMAAWYRLDKKACFYVEGVTLAMIRENGKAEFMPKYAQFEGVLEGKAKELEIVSFGIKGTEPR